jgi:agmatinase
MAVDLSGFDPNSVGLKSNNIFGLPFIESDAELILLPVPWEVTISYRDGTSRGPENIFEASMQVDLYDPDNPDAWKNGLYMLPVDKTLKRKVITCGSVQSLSFLTLLRAALWTTMSSLQKNWKR